MYARRKKGLLPWGQAFSVRLDRTPYLASSAVLATVLPADETSLPAPSIVLQALTNSAAVTTANPMILRIIVSQMKRRGATVQMRDVRVSFRLAINLCEEMIGPGNASGGGGRRFRAHGMDSESGGA